MQALNASDVAIDYAFMAKGEAVSYTHLDVYKRQYLKTYSDQTIRNIFWSGNNYVLPKTPAKIGTKITYWYGDEEKKDRRSDIRFIKHYFPQARIHGIPKMAHAELVMISPEEFCRYFDKFMCR